MADINVSRVGGARPVIAGDTAKVSASKPQPKQPNLAEYRRITGQAAQGGKPSWVQVFASAERHAAVDWLVGQMQETV